MSGNDCKRTGYRRIAKEADCSMKEHVEYLITKEKAAQKELQPTHPQNSQQP